MIFYFVRHGETDWNVEKKIQGATDIPLNKNGLRQAKELADRLVKEEYQIVRAYTSPHSRAAVTAQLVADTLKIECISLEGLAEMNLGEWEGGNWEKIEEVYGEIYYNWNSHRRYVPTPKGECYNDVLKRTFEALKIILERETENVLVVSHSAVFMSLRCYLAEGCMDDETMLQFRMKNTGIIEITAEEIKKGMARFEAEEGLRTDK